MDIETLKSRLEYAKRSRIESAEENVDYFMLGIDNNN